MKKIIFIFLLFISFASLAQTTPIIVKGSELETATTPSGSDFLIGLQGGHTKKFPYSYLIGIMGGNIDSVFGRVGNIHAQAGDYASFYYPYGSNPAKYLTTVTSAQVRRFFSGVSPIVYDSANARFSMTAADPSHDGYLTLANFNLFNNKETTLYFRGGLQRVGNVVSGRVASSSDTGLVIPSQKAIWDNKQNAISIAQNKFLGRYSSGTGTFEQIGISSDFSFAGGILSLSGSLGGVPSVFGRTGPIVAMTGDYTPSQVGAYPVGNPLGFVDQSGARNAISSSGPYTEYDPATGIIRDPFYPENPANKNISNYISNSMIKFPSDYTVRRKIDSLATATTTAISLKQNILTFTPEDEINKRTSLVPADDIGYPTTKAVSDALDSLSAHFTISGSELVPIGPLYWDTTGTGLFPLRASDGSPLLGSDGHILYGTTDISTRLKIYQADSSHNGYMTAALYRYVLGLSSGGGGGTPGPESDPIFLTDGVKLATVYANPGFVGSLPWSKITSPPSFLTSETDPLYTANGVPKTRTVSVNSSTPQALSGNVNITIPTEPSNGDKSDITVTGEVWTIDNNTVGTNILIDGGVHGADLENFGSAGQANLITFDSKGREQSKIFMPYLTRDSIGIVYTKTQVDNILNGSPVKTGYNKPAWDAIAAKTDLGDFTNVVGYVLSSDLGVYIPRTGTTAGNPVTGSIEMIADANFKSSDIDVFGDGSVLKKNEMKLYDPSTSGISFKSPIAMDFEVRDDYNDPGHDYFTSMNVGPYTFSFNAEDNTGGVTTTNYMSLAPFSTILNKVQINGQATIQVGTNPYLFTANYFNMKKAHIYPPVLGDSLKFEYRLPSKSGTIALKSDIPTGGGGITTEADPVFTSTGALKATTISINGVTQSIASSRSWTIPTYSSAGASGDIQTSDGVGSFGAATQFNFNSSTNKFFVGATEYHGFANIAAANALSSPAVVNIVGGTTSKAGLRLVSGSLLTSPVNGSVEYDGTHAYFTVGSTRKQIDNDAPPSTLTINNNVNNRVLTANGTTGSIDAESGMTIDAFGNVIIPNLGGGSVDKMVITSSSGALSSTTMPVSLTAVAFGSTPNSNGGAISGNTLTLQPADATRPGGVINGDQNFGTGRKTLGAITVSGTKVNGGVNFGIKMGGAWIDENSSSELILGSNNGSGSDNIRLTPLSGVFMSSLTLNTTLTTGGNATIAGNADINGDAKIGGALKIRGLGGGSHPAGIANLVSGTETISDSYITTNSLILLTPGPTFTNIGRLKISAQSAGQFTITSSSSSDTGAVNYIIIEKY